MALNDEAGAVRALAIRVVGRLAGRNPAYVMPALRRHLMQLLSDMDHLPDSRHREGVFMQPATTATEGLHAVMSCANLFTR